VHKRKTAYSFAKTSPIPKEKNYFG